MKRSPHPVDKHVGSRVRMRRNMIGMSQEKLGDLLDLTFQQVQKYEKGTNRMGASRLAQLASILNVPVAWFFEDGPKLEPRSREVSQDVNPAWVHDFMANSEGLRLAKSFMAMKPARRRALVNLSEEMVA